MSVTSQNPASEAQQALIQTLCTERGVHYTDVRREQGLAEGDLTVARARRLIKHLIALPRAVAPAQIEGSPGGPPTDSDRAHYAAEAATAKPSLIDLAAVITGTPAAPAQVTDIERAVITAVAESVVGVEYSIDARAREARRTIQAAFSVESLEMGGPEVEQAHARALATFDALVSGFER